MTTQKNDEPGAVMFSARVTFFDADELLLDLALGDLDAVGLLRVNLSFEGAAAVGRWRVFFLILGEPDEDGNDGGPGGNRKPERHAEWFFLHRTGWQIRRWKQCIFYGMLTVT